MQPPGVDFQGCGRIQTLNPLTKGTFVLLLLAAAFTTRHWWINPLVFVLFLIPASLAAGVLGRFIKSVGGLFLPFFLFLVLVYALFLPETPGGVRALGDFSWSTPGFVKALEIGGRVLVMTAAFTLFFLTTHPGRLMNALAASGAPWRLAYLVSATLQVLPVMQMRKENIVAAQRSRGLKVSTGLIGRIRALLPLITPLVYSCIVDVDQRALALEARGFSRKGPRTAYDEEPDAFWEPWLRRVMAAASVLLVIWRIGLCWS